MSKGAAAIAIIALLVGATGLGYAYLTTPKPDPITPLLLLLELLEQQEDKVRAWYSSDEIFYATLMQNMTIDDLTIEFTTKRDGLLIIYFSANLTIQAGGEWIYIRIRLDGNPKETWNSPQYWTGSYLINKNITIILFPKGSHNITVEAYSSWMTTFVANSSLIVRYFPYS